ncbi:hypothetical protein HanIR_Chr17g0895831 [Helianthus annuus]|nr:hypothetical protein HanIR_Chr17g0895831 [Helianthus annuus]
MINTFFILLPLTSKYFLINIILKIFILHVRFWCFCFRNSLLSNNNTCTPLLSIIIFVSFIITVMIRIININLFFIIFLIFRFIFRTKEYFTFYLFFLFSSRNNIILN